MKTLLAALLCAAPAVHAEIVDSSASGFTVKFSASVRATADDVYRRIVRVGDWWSSSHTYSGDAHNLSIDDRSGGCFCEKLADGGFVEHLRVVYARPGKALRMYGGLGPLQGIAAAGPMTFQLKAEQDRTTIELTYSVAGYLPKGVASWAGPVDTVLGAQFARLKTYAETGTPPGKTGEPTTNERPSR